MSQKPDPSYRQAQSRLVHEAAKAYQTPGWGQEDDHSRTAYDRDLRRSMPVNGKGRRTK
ncbi:hypothetical protein AB0F17_64920 [Nonomuraea sp. NPDC026600]|uniref:hypothetical protein n=1 Tax=Nonomuraea sp. NPDC026600 TaxID=3155363 RepID=UPI0034017616